MKLRAAGLLLLPLAAKSFHAGSTLPLSWPQRLRGDSLLMAPGPASSSEGPPAQPSPPSSRSVLPTHRGLHRSGAPSRFVSSRRSFAARFSFFAGGALASVVPSPVTAAGLWPVGGAAKERGAQAGLERAVELRRRPPPVVLKRPPMSLEFAVLLMRSSYEVVDELDFVAMDAFQRDFFLNRQDEYRDYLNALKGTFMIQGDLTDQKYFDFISFAQHDTISRDMARGTLSFEEAVQLDPAPAPAPKATATNKKNEGGAGGAKRAEAEEEAAAAAAAGEPEPVWGSRVVRRGAGLPQTNALLPAEFDLRVGDRLLGWVVQTYNSEDGGPYGGGGGGGGGGGIGPGGGGGDGLGGLRADLAARAAVAQTQGPLNAFAGAPNGGPVGGAAAKAGNANANAGDGGGGAGTSSENDIVAMERPTLAFVLKNLTQILNWFQANGYMVSFSLAEKPGGGGGGGGLELSLEAPATRWAQECLRIRGTSVSDAYEVKVLLAYLRRCGVVAVASPAQFRGNDVTHSIAIKSGLAA